MILNSDSLALWETIEKDLKIDASGPKAITGAVYKLQQVNTIAVHSLVKHLKELSLLKEPGQDAAKPKNNELTGFRAVLNKLTSQINRGMGSSNMVAMEG